MNVFVANEQELPIDVERSSALARHTLSSEDVADETELSILYIAPDHMRKLNVRFAGHDYATDVLAFPLMEDGDEEGDYLLGDVVICPQIANENAQKLGHDLDVEIDTLIIHGTLHLLGYDHQGPEDKARMDKRLDEVLKSFRGTHYMSDALTVLLIVVLLVLAASMALAETAITRMTRVKAHHLAQEKRRGGEKLVKIVLDPAPYLNSVLLLTLVAHVTGTAIATGLAIAKLGGGAEAVASAAMTFVIFVFAEVVPKTYSVQRTDRAALAMAGPVYLLGNALRPLSNVLIWFANLVMIPLPGRGLPKGPFVTEDEIRHMVDVAEEEEEIEEEEREMIHSIFEFGDTVVREVMVPRPDMIVLKGSTPLQAALSVIIEAGYSRIPLYESDTDNIIGVLYAKDLMKRMHEGKEGGTVAQLGRAPTFVPETKKVAELLREMQTQHVHMAIVVDEYGGTAGLVTIEDLIEEIVGEIVDEYDKEEPLVEPIDDHTMRVDAKMPIDEVNDLFDVELPHEEWDTVGGLVFGLTGRVPLPGEKVRFDGLEFTTERVTGRRVKKVVISRTGETPPPEETP